MLEITGVMPHAVVVPRKAFQLKQRQCYGVADGVLPVERRQRLHHLTNLGVEVGCVGVIGPPRGAHFVFIRRIDIRLDPCLQAF